MKRIWLFLKSRRAQKQHVSSGSSKGDNVMPESQDNSTPTNRKSDTNCQEKEDRHSPSVSSEAKSMLGSSTHSLAGAPGVLQPAPALESTGDLARSSQSALCKSPADEGGSKEGKSSGKESHGSQEPSGSLNVQLLQTATDQSLQMQEELQEKIESLSEELRSAEGKARRLEKEVEQLKKALSEKTLALDRQKREFHQQHALQQKQDQEREDAIKKAEGLQEQLTQLQRENRSLRQQLEDVQKETAQEQMRSVRELQEKVNDAIKKQRAAETSLQCSVSQCNYLKEKTSHLREDLDKAEAKFSEVSAQLESKTRSFLQCKAINRELQGLVTLLQCRLETPTLGHIRRELHGELREQLAQTQMGLYNIFRQSWQLHIAAETTVRGVSNIVASLKEQTKLDLERERRRWEESEEEQACVQAGTDISERPSLLGLDMGKWLTKKPEESNEMLAEVIEKNSKPSTWLAKPEPEQERE